MQVQESTVEAGAGVATASRDGLPEVVRTKEYPIRYDAFARQGVLFVRSPGAPVIGPEFACFCEDIANPAYSFRASGLYVEIIEYPAAPRATQGALRVEAVATRPDRTRTEVVLAETFAPGAEADAVEYARTKIVELRAWLREST